MTALRVQRVDPRTDPRWRELNASASGGLFTSPPWISVLAGCYGLHPAARVASDPDGAPVAGLAWVDVDDIRGRRRLALPFSDRADPVLTGDPAQREAGWAAVCADALAGDLPFALRCLDGGPAGRDARLVGTAQAAWHATPLDAPAEVIHQRLRSQTRRNIAAAQRAGVEVSLHTGLDAVLEFRTLHLHLRRMKYGLLAQSREFFEDLWKAFAPADAIRVGLARYRGVPIAGALYLVWGRTLYYKFGASRPEHLSVRPNDALHWAAIRWALDRGLTSLDWGLSDLDQPGLVRYKRGWATEERRIHTLRSARPLPDRRPDVDDLLTALTGLLTDAEVPDRVTDAAGALLYRYFC